MMNYNEFIENVNFNLGEWIIGFDDDYIKNIVNRFTKNIDIELDLINVINTLSNSKKKELKSEIEEYLKNGLTGEKSVNAYVDLNENVDFQGKNTFTSFLKAMTALGYKPNEIYNENWLFYYSDTFKVIDIKEIFNRFKSLSKIEDYITYDVNDVELYFGIKENSIEYGIKSDKIYKIGSFIINNSILKWLKNIDSKSIYNLKKSLVNLKVSDIQILNLIKTDMRNFKIESEEKSAPVIIDNIIKFGYKGIGDWKGSVLLDESLSLLKSKLSKFVLSKKWGSKVLINVSWESYWIYFSIKIK